MKTKVLVSIVAVIAGLIAVVAVTASVMNSMNDKKLPPELTLSAAAPSTAAEAEQYGSDAGFPPIGGEEGLVDSGPGFDSPVTFGDTVTFASGLVVTISDVTYGPANADYPGNYDLSYKVTVKNGTGQRLDGVTTTVETPVQEFMGPSFSMELEEMPTLFAGDEGSEFQGAMLEQDISGETIRIYVDDLSYGASAVWEGVMP